MKRLRPRLTYSGVASTLALVLALGTGTVYAANEWTGANIQNATLTGADIKNGSVAGIDLKNGNVASIDIKDGSLTGVDVADGGLTGADVADGGLAGADVADGGLTGTDVADGGLTGDDIANGSLKGDLEIEDNSITTFDLAENSVDSDEVLDFGLSNEDIGVLFALVNADGTLAASSGGVTSLRIVAGQYEVDFGRNVSQCAPLATQGNSGAGTPIGGIMGVADRGGNAEAVFVSVIDDDGAFVDRSFVLIVVC